MITALIVLAVGTFVMKAVDPVIAAGRELPAAISRLTTLLPAALLAVGRDPDRRWPRGLVVDARIVGVTAAGVAVLLKAPFAVVVLIGAAVTAGVRAIGWG